MTNASSRQKAANTNTNTNKGSKATPNATNAQVKPVSAKAASAAVQPTKVAATVAAAPTRAVKSAGKTNTKAVTTTVAKNTSAKPFAVTDVTAWAVQRARQIRKTDFERFVKLHNFFTASDDAVARPINNKTNAKREQVDQWLRGAFNPKVLLCIQEVQEPQQALLALIIVSAAIAKYGENELTRRDKLGEMDSVIGARFDTSGLRSKQQMPQTVGASYVLRLVLGLAPEKRAACQTLRDILTHESNGRLVLTPTTQGLKPVFGTASTDSDDWDNLNQYKLKHMIKQAQSAKFQEAMQQLGGQHLYDAIRTQLKQAGGATMWDANKDKPALQVKNLRPRSNSTDQKAQLKQQTAKKNTAQKQVQTVKKHLPVEVAKAAHVPPPAPVSVKSVPTVQVKKDTTVKAQEQYKNPVLGKDGAAVKDVAPVKSATPVKNVPAAGAWAGPLPASIFQSRPGAIVSSTPTISNRAVVSGRTVLSRAL
jgi:hypothetical protein